jgi:hypothetical protein
MDMVRNGANPECPRATSRAKPSVKAPTIGFRRSSHIRSPTSGLTRIKHSHPREYHRWLSQDEYDEGGEGGGYA